MDALIAVDVLWGRLPPNHRRNVLRGRLAGPKRHSDGRCRRGGGVSAHCAGGSKSSSVAL